jgi:hypothetical protein
MRFSKMQLLYAEGDFPRERRRNNEFVLDVLTSEGRDKNEHEWGQGDGGICPLIDALTEPGELIIDPFAGTAKWGRIAAERGRRWLGADIVEGGDTIIKTDELPTEPTCDAADDFAKSLDVAYDHVRERQTNGSPGRTPSRRPRLARRLRPHRSSLAT